MDYSSFNLTLQPLNQDALSSAVKIILDDNQPIESIFDTNEPLIEPSIISAWASGKYFDIAAKIAFEEIGKKLTCQNFHEFKHRTIQNIAKYIIISTIENYRLSTLINSDLLIQVNLQLAALFEEENLYQIAADIDGKRVIEEERTVNFSKVLDKLEMNSELLLRLKEQNSDETESYMQMKQYTDGAYTLENLKF